MYPIANPSFRVAFLVMLAAAPMVAAANPVPSGPEEIKELKYRSIGPSAGGRTCRSCGIAGDPLVYYTATAGSGIWKSTDGGLTWKPIFDDQAVSSVGSIAVAPSNANVIYVGTGEANIRGNVQIGDGIYKSIDAGKTWKHVWKSEGQIGQIIVHPTNSDIAFAAVLGKAFAPNPDRGIYRTTDGGKTWRQVLYRDPDTGGSDICFDPTNPNIIFAGLWQTRRRPWEMTSGGPGSGLHVSRDGGDTWKRLGGAGVAADDLNGLPEGIYGRVSVAVAPSDPRRVYAMIEAEEDRGGLYRSDDGGNKWTLASNAHYLRQRPWYFSTVHVDPQNPDVVWCPNVRLLKSIDAGKTWKQVKGTHHVDHHDLWIDPRNPKRMIDSNDGGVDITTNGGETWYAPPLPIGQFYRINVDNRVPYWVSGTMQDIGAASGPSNSLSTEGIRLADWHMIGGGEAGHTVHDPSDPNIVYAGEYGGYISRYDHRTRQARNITIYPTTQSGHGAEALRYRFQWTAPILISPHDPKTVYHAANILFQTTDAGQSWRPISGDLTRNDKSKQKWSGGPITGDNTGVEVYNTIFAVAESPRQKGLLWAGSDDGLVHLSRDAGKTWENVTPRGKGDQANVGIPDWATVQCIEASPHDAGTAYLVAHNYRLDDNQPYLWKTSDFGKTWKSLTPTPAAGAGVEGAGVFPADEFLHVVREDPKKKGLLYVGSRRGVWFSTDDGATWKRLRLNLPTVQVNDLRLKDNDLVVGTNGRSIWILDDLTPIRELTPAVSDQPGHLFSAQPAYRWRYHGELEGTQERTAGDNPPKGAVIHYWLKQKPKDPIRLEVLDGKGSIIATLTSKKAEDEESEDDPDAPWTITRPTVLPTSVGVNRVVWNMRHHPPELIKGAKWDGGNPKLGPLVLPGTYTLRLNVDGRVLTGSLQVVLDPRVHLPLAVLEEQQQHTLALADEISKVSQMVNAIRAVRRQLHERHELLKENPKFEPLVKAGKAAIDKLNALEGKLHNPKAQVSYDILAQKGGAQLWSKQIILYEWMHDSDGRITQGMREVRAELQQDLQRLTAEFRMLMDELSRLNELARKLDLPGVIVPGVR